jgi:hypothetical protein
VASTSGEHIHLGILTLNVLFFLMFGFIGQFAPSLNPEYYLLNPLSKT